MELRVGEKSESMQPKFIRGLVKSNETKNSLEAS
jgi:hypothetical protein